MICPNIKEFELYLMGYEEYTYKAGLIRTITNMISKNKTLEDVKIILDIEFWGSGYILP